MDVAKKPSDPTEIALTVEGLVKRYVPVERGMMGLFSRKKPAKEVLALDDVSFALPKGQVLGIVGRNGAGKSTLLRILAGITQATAGKVTIRGRFASILEIGTGFHPDLSGRENIFLNGQLLGFTKKEIAERFEQIVAFSGVGEFIDLPIKQYSNGMYLRLAFSVAFHSDIEILLLDEILAVGDAEFQQKSYERIQELARNGTSIIVVSHNLSSISRMCDRVILLERGKMVADGNPQEILAGYAQKAMQRLMEFSNTDAQGFVQSDGSKEFANWEIPGVLRLLEVGYWNEGSAPNTPVFLNKPIFLSFTVEKLVPTESLELVLRVMDLSRAPLLVDSMGLREDYQPADLASGRYRYQCKIPAHFFSHGFFPLALTFSIGGDQWVGEVTNLPGLRIFPDLGSNLLKWYAQMDAPVYFKFDWERIALD